MITCYFTLVRALRNGVPGLPLVGAVVLDAYVIRSRADKIKEPHRGAHRSERWRERVLFAVTHPQYDGQIGARWAQEHR